jgi:Fuc2NAc and GlcNAc transferase
VILPIVIALILSAALTGMVRAYAVRRRLMDHPNERSSHTVPTPRGGGLGILVTAACASAFAVTVGTIPARVVIILGIGTTILAVIGWLDDGGGVSSKIRLLLQVLIALATVVAFGGLPTLTIGSHVLPAGLIGGVVATIGIVWAVNLFNFMDGIDGLAGSQATLIFGAAALLLFRADAVGLAALAGILAASSLGFLLWNWPPAKIFMGDVGSGPLGYLVASLALVSERAGAIPILVFGILGGVFVCDATVTLLRRFLRGKRPDEAHRDHAYQRLARAWGRHQPVTLAAAGVTLLLSALGAMAVFNPALLLIVTVGSFVLLGLLMLAAERRAPMKPYSES